MSTGDGGVGISRPNAELPPVAIFGIVRAFGRHDSPEAAFSDLYLTNMRIALKLRAYRRYGTWRAFQVRGVGVRRQRRYRPRVVHGPPPGPV